MKIAVNCHQIKSATAKPGQPYCSLVYSTTFLFQENLTWLDEKVK